MIENRQKTPSGPQGVLLGVPKDPQTTQMAIQDAKMWLPELPNIRLWCQKGGKPESRRVKDWGPAAEGEALKIRRARPWPAVGVVSWDHPRKVPTFPGGKLGSAPCAAGPPPTLSRAFKNHAFFHMLKKSEKSHKIASQGEPKWSQKSQKSPKNAFRVPLEKQTGKKKNRNCENPDSL